VVSVYNVLPHRSESSYKDFRRIVVEQVYQSILNERFAVIARRPDAPFVGAGAGIESQTREIDAFGREAQAKPGKVEATLESLSPRCFASSSTAWPRASSIGHGRS
jgi:hypothetical protein